MVRLWKCCCSSAHPSPFLPHAAALPPRAAPPAAPGTAGAAGSRREPPLQRSAAPAASNMQWQQQQRSEASVWLSNVTFTGWRPRSVGSCDKVHTTTSLPWCFHTPSTTVHRSLPLPTSPGLSFIPSRGAHTFAMLMRAIASSFHLQVTLAGGGSCPFCSRGITAMHWKLAVIRGTSCSGAWGMRRAKASRARACCAGVAGGCSQRGRGEGGGQGPSELV